ncbi:MAG TPA: hypothetical protein VF950_24115 [Planctomycetota bacterium]
MRRAERKSQTPTPKSQGIPPAPRGGRTAAWALLLLLAACEPEPPPSPPAPPPPPQVPEPPLPPLADVAFPAWEEVEPEHHPALPAGAAEPLRWGFPEGRRFGYAFDQTVRQVTTAAQGERSGSMNGRDRNGGTFEVVGRGSGTAGVLVSIESREAFRDDKAVSVEESRQKGPSKFEAELREDGAATIKRLGEGSDAQLFFDLLLALREGSRTAEGGATVTTRIAGRRKVGRNECVRLETEMEFAGPTPGGRRLLRGRSVGYFDPAEGRFIRASAAVSASQRQNGKDKLGGWVTQSVDSRTHFRVELLRSP